LDKKSESNETQHANLFADHVFRLVCRIHTQQFASKRKFIHDDTLMHLAYTSNMAALTVRIVRTTSSLACVQVYWRYSQWTMKCSLLMAIRGQISLITECPLSLSKGKKTADVRSGVFLLCILEFSVSTYVYIYPIAVLYL